MTVVAVEISHVGVVLQAMLKSCDAINCLNTLAFFKYRGSHLDLYYLCENATCDSFQEKDAFRTKVLFYLDALYVVRSS